MGYRLKDVFIGKYNKSVMLTYCGVAISIIGMVAAFNKNINYSLSCLIIAGICDLFDGKVARMCIRTDDEKNFGVEIDSLADIFNFIAFPIVIFISMGLKSTIDTFLYVFYALAGITRLGYFNIKALKNNTEEPINIYQGLPVTYSALILSTGFLLSYFMSDIYFLPLYKVFMLFTGLAFILNIPISKPRGKAYILFSVLAVIMLIVLLGIIRI